MKFYCIIRSMNDRRFPKRTFALLKDACEKRNIEFVSLESEKIDLINLPKLGAGDMLYRVNIDTKSSQVAAQLLGPKVASFFVDSTKGGFSKTHSWGRTITHKMSGLPIIPTIIDLPKGKETLDKYVRHLGGYPIIVKVEGGSHGVGVIRADSPEALYSLTDYLRTIPNVNGALRQYIDFSAQARLIVLGNRVVGSLDYKKPKNDFRSNAGNLIKAVPQKFSPEVEAAAIKATHMVGYEFGGVDILIDKDKKTFYLAEVNFPCNFSRYQDITGEDIAGLMVDHLLAKARKTI